MRLAFGFDQSLKDSSAVRHPSPGRRLVWRNLICLVNPQKSLCALSMSLLASTTSWSAHLFISGVVVKGLLANRSSLAVNFAARARRSSSAGRFSGAGDVTKLGISLALSWAAL